MISLLYFNDKYLTQNIMHVLIKLFIIVFISKKYLYGSHTYGNVFFKSEYIGLIKLSKVACHVEKNKF